jgi:hypothetical protein
MQDSTLYNPRIKDATAATPSNLRAFQKTSDTWMEPATATSPASGSQQLFATDFLSAADNSTATFSAGYFAHYPAQGFDVLFRDGSISFVQSTTAFNMVANGANGGLPTTETAGSNLQYDMLFNYLENGN